MKPNDTVKETSLSRCLGAFERSSFPWPLSQSWLVPSFGKRSFSKSFATTFVAGPGLHSLDLKAFGNNFFQPAKGKKMDQ